MRLAEIGSLKFAGKIELSQTFVDCITGNSLAKLGAGARKLFKLKQLVRESMSKILGFRGVASRFE
jgi:hypothetical protein